VFMNTIQIDAASLDRLSAVARTIVARDDGSLGVERKPFFPGDTPLTPLLYATAKGVVAAVIFLVLAGRGGFGFQASHLIPTALQTALLTYWWVYWPPVGRHVPALLAQIVLAYAVDACVWVLKERTWRVGFGPLPIVLSSNLFAWFSSPGA